MNKNNVIMDDIGNSIEENNNKNEDIMLNVLFDMVKSQRKMISKLLKTFVFVVICYTIILIGGIIGFFWYESQFEIVTEETITTTTTQEVSGEDSEINNVQGNMYKDDAIHNEGGE